MASHGITQTTERPDGIISQRPRQTARRGPRRGARRPPVSSRGIGRHQAELSNRYPTQRNAIQDEDYLSTERVQQRQSINQDGVIRCIVKLDQPIHLKALALVRSGLGHNLINHKLAQQLNLTSSATTETQMDPITGDEPKIYGQHTLEVVVADHAGVTRNFNITFLETDLVEDMIFGMDWLMLANPTLDFRDRSLHWRAQ